VPTPDWNERYRTGDLPWDTGAPDAHLVKLVESGRVRPGKCLEVGCGTGTNALWLASRGFDVLGVDIAHLAVERANGRIAGTSLRCAFTVLDFLQDRTLTGPFEFVFDRGCLHSHDEASDRSHFALRVSHLLPVGGLWFSLIGSTEGAPRDTGPPRRTATDVVSAIEPHLEIVELQSVLFETNHAEDALAWHCLARHRSESAQPSTRRQ